MFHQGITRAELGRRIGMSGPSISLKLRGQVGWSLADLYATAEALGVNVDSLMPSYSAQAGFTPAPYVPGTRKAPAPDGAGAPGLVAGAGFEPATSGL
ncbi:helix-turn-helix domain-containing protein [Actinomyces oricola]|nr:helix-turn-helix transcriptional regulator [Actinomyces oricola]